MSRSKYGPTCLQCGKPFQPLSIDARRCPACQASAPTPRRKADDETGQIHLQMDLLSWAALNPLRVPKLPRDRHNLQDRFDRVVDTLQARGTTHGQLTALESQRSQVATFASRQGAELTYRGFVVSFVRDEQ
jgi:hypothetical protein